MSKYIYWTGKTTDKVLTYKAQGETFKEVYEHICEKYGYDFLDDNAVEHKQLVKLMRAGAKKSDYTDDNGELNTERIHEDSNEHGFELSDYDYRDIISESDSNAYYQEFDIQENHIIHFLKPRTFSSFTGTITYDSFEEMRDDLIKTIEDNELLGEEELINIEYSDDLEELQDWLEEYYINDYYKVEKK